MIPEYKNNISMPELLAPAGDRDCLEAAIKNGADAVYLGVREFNARLYARNFSLEELGKAIKHAHDRGVRVYLTLNTLVKNREVNSYFNVLSRAYELGIDGVIIQHLSFLDIIKQSFPGLAVFISTQGAIGNASGASILKKADRIILPRELTLEEIKRIIHSGVRVEVFVHGALCFSYSGLCLFSSFVSSRSGNRGSCAQLCRQKYNGSYLLSTRELCLVRRIPELISAGISGFKIEGRMRNPLYVAVATRLYRKAIDSFRDGKFVVPAKEMAEIEVVFNREFTEGFASGESSLTSPEKPMNRGAFLGVLKGGELVPTRDLAVGDGVGIWSQSGVTGVVLKEITVGNKKILLAKAGQKVNIGIQAEEGSRVYMTSSARISIEPDFVINRKTIKPAERRRPQIILPEINRKAAPALKLMARVYSITEALEASRAGAGIVFYNIFAPDFLDKAEWKGKALLGAYLPRIMSDEELLEACGLLINKKPSAIMAGNLGFLSRRTEFDVPVYLDYSLNAFNDLDFLFFQRYGVTPIISPELTINELAGLKNKDAVVFCHGDIVVVNSKIYPGAEELVDEKGSVFCVRKENSYWQILNSRPFGLFDDILKLKDYGFTQFFIDKQDDSPRLAGAYHRLLEGGTASRRMRKGCTSGHLYRPAM